MGFEEKNIVKGSVLFISRIVISSYCYLFSIIICTFIIR